MTNRLLLPDPAASFLEIFKNCFGFSSVLVYNSLTVLQAENLSNMDGSCCFGNNVPNTVVLSGISIETHSFGQEPVYLVLFVGQVDRVCGIRLPL